MEAVKLLYSRKEAKAMLGCSLASLDKLIRQKRLTVVMIGDRPMLTIETLKKFIETPKDGKK